MDKKKAKEYREKLEAKQRELTKGFARAKSEATADTSGGGTEDFVDYAVNAYTGGLVWTSSKLGDVLQASPAGLFSDIVPGAPNLLFVGTRNATSAYTLYALNPATGAIVDQFNNGGGASAIGIITGITVDYTTNYVYFTSRAAGGGLVPTVGAASCTPRDSEKTESTTQIANLEVLAAMANHGNEVAYYALLDELRSIAMNTALYEAMQADDMAGYREFRNLIFPDGEGLARFDKSQRYWANDPATLEEILKKYSVDVFHAVQHGRFQVDLPGDHEGTTIYGLDDLRYVINHLPRK